MTFEEDLTKRRIDVAVFAAGDPDRFAEWQLMYGQMHPNSFYVSVKMVINDVRRRFWLAEAVKPVAPPVAETAAKPAARRATIPAAASKPTETVLPENTAADANPVPNPSPVKARPVIRRPVPTNTETPPEISTPVSPAAPALETSGEAPKPPRARPVFRKPVSAPENSAEPNTAASQVAQDGTNAEIPVHTNPDPEAAPAKRPRPVIKRPMVRDTPENPEAIAPTSAPAIPDPVPDFVPDTKPEDTPVPKPPRPRPVFKRPAPVTSPAESAPASEEVTEIVEPPVRDTTASAEVTEDTAAALPPPAKQPRPRPVMRPPAPLAVSTATPELPPDQATPESPPAEAPPEEPRKTPRPRPVFKRPTPPETPNESV